MEIRYTILPDDYAEANKLMLLNTTFGRKFNYYVYFWILPIVSVVLLLLALLILVKQGRQGFGAALPLLFLGVVWLLCAFSFKRRVRRSYRMQKLGKERVASFSPSGVSSSHFDGEVSGRYAWTAIDKYLETERLFVLFPNQMQFIPIPKRVMTAEQINEFRNLVTAHVSNASR